MSDDGERKWSTPLAKQLSEAITVRPFCSIDEKKILILLKGYRTSPISQLHAHVLDIRSRRILYLTTRWTRPLRPERGLHNVS